MREWFEKLSRNNKLLSILMVVLGLVLIIWPGKTLTLAARILGIALLAAGAVSCISWYRDRRKVSANPVSLAIGIVCVVAGIIVLAAPQGVVKLLPKLVGLAVALNGVLNLAQALDQRRAGDGKWTAALAMAALTIIAGLFIFFHAFGVMEAAVMVIGAVILYNGASNLWIESRYKKM